MLGGRSCSVPRKSPWRGSTSSVQLEVLPKRMWKRLKDVLAQRQSAASSKQSELRMRSNDLSFLGNPCLVLCKTPLSYPRPPIEISLSPQAPAFAR